MIDIKEELLLDFGINTPRIVISDKLVLLDNIIKIIDFSATGLIIKTGKNSYIEIGGNDIYISSVQNSRIICNGEINTVTLHKNKKD